MIRLFIIAAICALAASHAAEGRIVKVLPHLLDSKGRTALQPSLFERDAYQVYLREHPEEVSALRFDIQFKAKPKKQPLTVRLEVRGSKTRLGETRIFEQTTSAGGWFSNWTSIKLDRDTTDQIGQIIAWRATLWSDTEMIAQQQSFLW